jgi:hypothetical protein
MEDVQAIERCNEDLNPERWDTITKLQTLWIFATLNYVYGDVLTLFDKTIVSNLDQTALLGASILVETLIVMVVLTRVLGYRANRWVNIIVSAINIIAVVASLLATTPSAHYAFFAVIDLVTFLVIIWTAWKWSNPVGQMAP